MANNTRSSRKTTEENSKCRRTGGGGSDISLSAEISGLRRSTRDTSCTKSNTPKKSISQQLGQTDKQVATPPSVTRSLAKKVTTSVPLRRSKRGNKQSPSLEPSESEAGISSRSPEVNSKKRKVERRDKTLKQSTSGTMDATENVNEECDPRQDNKRIRMTARAYKSLFRKQERKVKVSGKYEELASPSRSPANDGSNPGVCMSNEHDAAIQSGHVTASKSLPGKETAENLYEEESTQINNSTGQVVIRDTANVNESLNQNGNDVDVYEERVVEGRADATAMAVCKDNLSVASPSSHQENHVDESAAVNMSRKSGEPEDGVDIRPDENNVQISVQKLKSQGNDAVAYVEQLPGCSAFGCKADSSQFMEYWVPAQLSHVQLEKYCSILLSSSLTLRSSLKSVIVGTLGDILADTRKCCDHPYHLPKDTDNSLQSFLDSLEPVQMLDTGIQASGKLDLLVKFLEEMRSRRMRTLILFQPISSNFGKDPKSSGDILDDMMRQKFGVDSYERVDSGLINKKVQTALSNFNDKELGRFVFLLEARACRPNIKLSSVDAVIVFTSDLNPANDIRNLQKLTLDSESEKIKVLRLYSCFTVEEKLLINSKQRTGMDGRQEEINLLLRWGASYLFDRLKEFHCSNDESSKLIVSDPLHANDVMKEFISLLSVVGENNIRNRSKIVRVQQNAGVYSTEFPLVGESKNHLSMEKLPHVFWAELLEGKCPPWRYLSNSGQRNRKRLQNNGDLHVGQGGNIDQTGKKRIKLAMDNGVHTKLANDKEAARSNPPPENGASNSMAEGDVARKRLNAQRSLLCTLQSDVSRLCEVLNLTDDVKQKADIFLDYVVNNHQVDYDEPELLQAFLFALCWTAASLLEVKVNRKESFELAKDRLGYCCAWDRADYVYKMMRCFKETFLNKTQSLEAEDCRTTSSNTSQLPVYSPVNGQENLEDIPFVQDNPSKSKSDDSDPNKWEKSMSGGIKKIKKKYLKLKANLDKERNKVVSTFEEAKANLDKEHLIEAAVVRSLHGEGPTRTDKLNALESEYNRKAEDHKNQMLASLSKLDDDRKALELKEASQIKELSEWFRTNLLKKPAELNGVRAAAPEEAPNAAGAPGEDPNEARAPEKATAVGKVPEEAPVAAKVPEEAPVAAKTPEEAPNEARAPEEAPAAAKAPVAAGAPEEAPNEATAREEAAASARAPEEAPAAAKAPEEATVVTSSSENPSNPVMRFRLSSKSNDVSLLVPMVTGANRLDQDREDVSMGPCCSESIPNGATSLLPGDEIPLNEHQTTSALAIENADQDNLPPQERDIPSEDMQSDRHLEGTVATHEETVNVPDGEAATDIGSIDDIQAAQDIIGDTSGNHIVGDATSSNNIPSSEVNVGVLDATSADEQDISGNSNRQEPQPEGRGNSTLPQLQDILLSVLSSIPEEPNNQSNAGSTSSRTHEGNASSVERLDAPALAHAVQCAVNTHVTRVPTNSTASGSGTGLMQPSFCMSSRTSDPLQIEIDRIRKQKDQNTKDFDSTKKKLDVECKKEIEEATAKIREKFALKIQEKAAECVSKNNELETNLQKVEMNKALAAAFRYKCVDSKQTVTLGTIRPAASFVATSVVVPPRASSPARASPLVKTLHNSSLRPCSPRPLLSQGQIEPVQRSLAPHLQSASRPSNGVAPRAVPPPPGYQPQSSSVPVAQFRKPRAVTQTGPSSTLANRMDQVSYRIPQVLNALDRLHITPNIPNVTQPSNFHLPPVNTTTTNTNTTIFSEARPLGERSNGCGIIDVANIIELSDEE